jgi:hypothetical protein
MNDTLAYGEEFDSTFGFWTSLQPVHFRASGDKTNGFHSVNIPTRPSPNTMRIFLKSVAMRSCE